jgi:hypothetical protein
LSFRPYKKNSCRSEYITFISGLPQFWIAE